MLNLIKDLYSTRSFTLFLAETTPKDGDPIKHYAVQNKDTKVVEFQHDVYAQTRMHLADMQGEMDRIDPPAPSSGSIN